MKAKLGEFEIEHDDLVSFNSELKKHDFSKVSSIEGNYYCFFVKVDLHNQDIYIDDKKIDIECPKLDEVRWIHFKRHYISISMAGKKDKRYSYGIGFQGKKDGENIQRFFLVSNGKWELLKKK